MDTVIKIVGGIALVCAIARAQMLDLGSWVGESMDTQSAVSLRVEPDHTSEMTAYERVCTEIVSGRGR